MMRFLAALAAVGCSVWAAGVKGRVVDANTKEPLARVLVRAGTETITAANGLFELPEAAGKLQVTCVGYRQFQMDVAAVKGELEIALVPDTLRVEESIDVTAGVFEAATSNSVNLAGLELRNLASVMADDPLRAVQGLPGVYANDDFSSQISLRGAGFQRTGVYLDGVLLHAPYHTLQGDATSASLTLVSSDVLDHVELHPGPLPASYADRTAGAIDMRTHDGDRKRIRGRAAASFSSVTGILEGPWKDGKGSWLVSSRKSYLQYLIGSVSDDTALGFGFWDVQGRATRDVGAGHRLSFSFLEGKSGLDRRGAESTLGLNGVFLSDYHVTILNAGSRWTPSGKLLLQNNVAWMRERYGNVNRLRAPLAEGNYGEWIFNSDNSWQWGENTTLLFGANVRRLRDGGFLDRRITAAPFFQRIDEWRGTALRAGGHVLQEARLASGKVVLRGGGRIDSHSTNQVAAASPTASVGLSPLAGTRITLAWGMAVQYPEMNQMYSRWGSTQLAAERSQHASVGLEQRVDSKTRIRMEAWQRLDRDLLFRPLFEQRILDGRIYAGSQQARFSNSVRGYARGWQAFIQRRTANGVTGWISYAFTAARQRDGITRREFASDFEQRHTANAFVSYRWRPTVNFSGRFSYGSGFPVRGFWRQQGDLFFLSAERNQLRMPSYHRMDFRANKTFIRKGWQMTLFAEVVNITNHDNVRFDEVRSVDTRTGLVRLGFDKLFPILPSAGLAFEF